MVEITKRLSVTFLTITIILLIILLIVGINILKKRSLIYTGMELEKARRIMIDFGAEEGNFLDIMPKESQYGKYMESAEFIIGENPFIILNYEKEFGKNIVKTIDLYYSYGAKSNPQNKSYAVSEIDLRKIEP